MFYNEGKRMVNRMNNVNLEYIAILGLFGRYDYKLPFDKEVNIYIGENGLGKTTILNCIYYILDKKANKLASINFSEIHVKFMDEDKHIITYADLTSYLSRSNFRGRYPTKYLEESIEELLNEYVNNHIYINESLSRNEDNEYFKSVFLKENFETISRNLSKESGIPLNLARNSVLKYLESERNISKRPIKRGNKENVDKMFKSITKHLNQRIIYLPTYRRIEDDLAKLDINERELAQHETLIRFGMSDVQIAIKQILNEIRTEAIKGFREMTGILLKQYTDGQDYQRSFRKKTLFNADTVKIVLDRVGDEIEDETKKKIIKLISNEEIYNPEYHYLLNLIDKLTASYDSQKILDDRVKLFMHICNKYLIGKQFFYNQGTLSLEIHLEEEVGASIELTQLSSGEKQIVSLFSKLCLESNRSSVVIIDEPELSLSMQWQEMLLPDIMRTKNCDLLLTVTHSPFIFNNEYDMDAHEIRRFMGDSMYYGHFDR